MPAQCGRASSELGTSDRQDVQSPRAGRWTTAVAVGASCFLRTGASATPSITAQVLRAGRQCDSMPFRYRLAVQYCSIAESCFRSFLAIWSRRKRTARLSPAVQVREETPREGQRQRGVGSHRVSYFADPRTPRIDEAQFSVHDSRATVRIAADQVGGTRTPCSRRNAPTTLIASATKRPRVSASASPSRGLS